VDLASRFNQMFAITDLGIDADSVRPEDLRRIRVISIVTLAMSTVIAIPIIAHYVHLGMESLSILVLATVVAALGNLAHLRKTRRPGPAGQVAVGLLSCLMFFSNINTGGFYDPNFAWFYIIPLCGAVLIDVRGAAVWTVVTILTTVGFWALPELGIELVSQVPAHLHSSNSLFNRVSAIFALAVIGASFVVGQRRAERQLEQANEELVRETAYVQLLMQGAVAANQAESLLDAMGDATERVCRAMGWIAGHAYNVTEDGSIVSTGLAFTLDRRLQTLKPTVDERKNRNDMEILAHAVSTQQPQSTNDLLHQKITPEAAALVRELGIGSAFAVPIPVDGTVVGVIEFASVQPIRDTERLTSVFSMIGAQIGKVAERTAQQERARQSQKMEAVGQLAAGVAHEINNPMAYVRSNLRELLEQWEAMRSKIRDDSAFAEFGDLIEESLEGVERTIAIVRDVREFSHTGSSNRANWETARLGDLVESALRFASSQAPAGIEIEQRYEPAPKCLCSPNQLRQVVVNLIVNAIQAVGDRGKIQVLTGREGDQVFARITDDGPGMREDTRERLFEPFFTTKPVGHGTGLGLSVSYEIARNHGGEIRVCSSFGAGASFELRLPIASDHS
jgi:two-component system NtrC family sensor kinase